MDTTKKFIKYAIVGALLFIYVTFASEMFVKQSYQDIKYNVELVSPQIVIDEARATQVNGYVKGQVNNNTSGYINNTNLKVDLYGITGTYLGTKYLELGNFKQDETKEFSLNFKISNVEECKVSLSEEGYISEKFEPMNEQDRVKVFGITLLILIILNSIF